MDASALQPPHNVVSMFIAAAFALVLVSAPAPDFRFDWEIEWVKLETDEKPPVFSRLIQRTERPLKGEGGRVTITHGGQKTIQTITENRITIETISPDGSRASQSVALNSDKNPWKPLLEMAKNSPLEGYKVRSLNEFKTIAGIRCQKRVATFTFDDEKKESVTWDATDPALSKRMLPSLETYTYSVDGDERVLIAASTAVSVKLAPATKTGKRRGTKAQ
jgi:hypothetical protein